MLLPIPAERHTLGVPCGRHVAPAMGTTETRNVCLSTKGGASAPRMKAGDSALAFVGHHYPSTQENFFGNSALRSTSASLFSTRTSGKA